MPADDTTSWIMPAEWELHSATLLAWPANRDTWPDDRQLEGVEQVYVQLIELITRSEPVVLLVPPDEGLHERVRKYLEHEGLRARPVRPVSYPTDDLWVRDSGPIVVHEELPRETPDPAAGRIRFTDWQYNAWGGKYSPWQNDNALPPWLAAYFGVNCATMDMVLEGGAVETNGQGVVITTESVLLNPNRNPGLSRRQVEQKLRRGLGARHVIWLKGGLKGDDTDGHVDELVRFVGPRTLVAAVSDDPDDPNYTALQQNLADLHRELARLDGEYEVIPLPMPSVQPARPTVDGSWVLPASYTNFYITNQLVIVPFYDSRYDEQVRVRLQELMPDRNVVGLPCRELVWGQGSIHCVTQQLYGVP